MSVFLRKPRVPHSEKAEVVVTRAVHEEHVLNASITNWESRSSMGGPSVNRRTCWEGHYAPATILCNHTRWEGYPTQRRTFQNPTLSKFSHPCLSIMRR